ncbi:ABC transporter permease [Intrasporangium sp. DVR]|uniref:ABC transporter permease n=1 Tax=Intrasporangium sp. DVR TaxID=3127867 RepID=UPI00313A4EC2
MLTYVLRRIGLGLTVLLATLVAAFLLFFAGPADPAQAMCPEQRCSPERLTEIRENLGLDRPLAAQFTEYFGGLFVGRDFEFAGDVVHCSAPCLGVSFLTKRPVAEEIFTRFPATALLALGTVAVFLAVGITIGVVTARARGSALDRLLIGGSQAFGAIPYYVVALVFALYLTRIHGILPQAVPLSDGLPGFLAGLLAPCLILGLVYSAGYARYTRSSMIETLATDYVRTARSKGISEGRVLRTHALRGALGPVVTILGLDVAALLSGTLVTEKIFEIDGIGKLSIDALVRDDLPIIMGTVLVTAVLVVTMNLVVDIAYSLIDPRVRLS